MADTRPPYLSIFRGEVDPEDIAALALKVGRVTCVFDELDQAFANKAFITGARQSSIRRIIHEGRHSGVSLMGGFRRTANVSEDLVSQCDYVLLFRTNPTSPGDLEAIEKRFGLSYAAAVQHLAMGQFVVWSDT